MPVGVDGAVWVGRVEVCTGGGRCGSLGGRGECVSSPLSVRIAGSIGGRVCDFAMGMIV